LLAPYRVGAVDAANRMVLAPMTRSRALEGNVANPLAAAYYVQRASAGLMVTEGTQVSPQGVGYIRTPGIHSAEQVAAWRLITDAVHRAGGRIFAQLWHVGRVSHPDFHGGALPVAPSAIGFAGKAFTDQGLKDTVIPRALALEELPGIVEQFRAGARNALEAGFDGVEIHGANGYLLDQFVRDGSNQRTDEYGGSIANRIRLPLEVTKAVVEVWGRERVGYRISPNVPSNGMSDSHTRTTFSALVAELSELGIAYLHVIDPAAAAERISPLLRTKFAGTYIVNGGFDLATARSAIERGEADMVSFGSPFIANPDLPERFRTGAPLATADRATFYSGEEKGYIDYPAVG
jgi:N-ethylmaleimide reductase